MQAGRRLVLCVLLLLAVAGCGTKAVQTWMGRITPPEDDALARDMIAALLREDYGFIIANMDRQALGETPEAALRQLYEYIDHDVPEAVELVGSNIFRSGTRRQSSITYQLEFPNSWCVAVLAIATDNGARQAISFHLQKLPASLAEINRFTFKGKTLVHFTFLLSAIGAPIFIVYALVQCIRTRIRRKWLWIVFILLGVGALKLNWTTGQIHLQALSLQLLGAGFVRRGLYAPWILTIAFPLGALLFLRKRRKLKVAAPGVTEAPCADEAQPAIPGGGFASDGL